MFDKSSSNSYEKWLIAPGFGLRCDATSLRHLATIGQLFLVGLSIVSAVFAHPISAWRIGRKTKAKAKEKSEKSQAKLKI